MRGTVRRSVVLALILGAASIAAPAARGAAAKPSPLVFSFWISPGREELEALILAGSIRRFAGTMADREIWAFVPKTLESVSEPTRERLAGLHVRIFPYPVMEDALRFPLAAKVFAAAEAESQAEGKAENLVWMDPDTIVVGEPRELILPKSAALGYRPVMHPTIGSRFDQPIDSFWSLIYEKCGVPAGRLTPMRTAVDDIDIRPFFNAGLLVVRPEKGLLRAWRDLFQRIYREPEFEAFYKKKGLYSVFVHQAVLAGTVLSRLDPAERREISPAYNYSLSLHFDYPEAKRRKNLDGLATVRYDQYSALVENPRWRDDVRIREPLRNFLDDELKILGIKALLYVGPKFGAGYFMNRDFYEQMGWGITLAGMAERVDPCPFYGGKLRVPPLQPDFLFPALRSIDAFDVLAIVPSSAVYQPDPFGELLAKPEAVGLVKTAVGRGLAVSTICAGARVLAAAGVLRGKTIVAHPNFRAEYEAAGAIFAGNDHPPIIEGNIVTGARDQYYDFGNSLALAAVVESKQGRGVHPAAGPGKFIFDAPVGFGEAETKWIRRLGGAGADGARAVAETPDGGFLLAGYTFSQGSGDADILAVKTDADGRLLWSKSFGGRGSEYADACLAVKDGFLIVGYTTSFGAGSRDVYVVKIDDNGREIWSKSYGGPGWDMGAAAAETPDGYLIAGSTGSFGAGEEDVYLIKIGFDGREVWSRTYGGPRSEIGNSVFLLPDGGVALGATTGSFGGGNCDFYLIRTDAQGRELWTRNYGSTMDNDLVPPGRSPFDWAMAMTPTSDGGFALVGYTNSRDLMNAHIVKTDGEGRLLWARTLGTSPFYDFANGVAETPNGDLVVCGTAKSNQGNGDIYVVTLSADGGTLGQATIGGPASEWGRAVRVTAGGEVVIAGQTGSGGWMESFDALFLKLRIPASKPSR